MKKKIRVVATIFLLLLVLGWIAIGIIYNHDMKKKEWVDFSFEESYKELSNPDRGFYIQTYTSDTYAQEMDFEPNVELRLLAMNLYSYGEKEVLPEAKIAELQQMLEAFRKQGVGVVFRAGYYFGEKKYTEPLSFSIIEGHCRQICDVLNEYSDIVLVVQAGFLGPYGEWHNSKYITDEEDENYEIELLKVLLEELDDSISVAVRRPMYIRNAINHGIDSSRLSYHDDAFLSTDTDMGTYVEDGYQREDELTWIQENLTYAVNGGETTNLSEFTNAKNAIEEMERLDFTYLNRYYNTKVLNSWKQQEYEGKNAFQYIRDHLGYRLHLKSISFLEKITPQLNFEVSGCIANTGFAPVTEKYQLYLVLKANEKISYIPIHIDTMTEDEIVFSQSVNIWEEIGEEELVQVGICMTKQLGAVNSSIEFANDDSLLYSDGINWITSYSKTVDEKWEKTQCYMLNQ